MPRPLTLSSDPPHVALLIETSLASGRDILRGVAAFVRQNSVRWSLFHVSGEGQDEAPDWLRDWKGAGIIARVSRRRTAKALAATGLPVVDVLGLTRSEGFPIVHVDDVAIADLAMRHFTDRGFKTFAFVGFTREDWQDSDWSVLRRRACEERALVLGGSIAIYERPRSQLSDIPWEERQEELAAWLKALPKPVGLMVCSDQRGIDVLDACRRASILVPEEIAVVGVDNDIPLCEVCHPPLSSVDANHVGVGYEAAALLDRMIRGEEAPTHPALVAPLDVQTRQSSDVMAVADPILKKALQAIREKACDGISIDDVTKASGASRSVLQRRFQAAFGRTIHDHLVDTRLRRAVDLIKESDLTLKAVAERCGFNHLEYMGVVFRQRLGRTPASFRRVR